MIHNLPYFILMCALQCRKKTMYSRTQGKRNSKNLTAKSKKTLPNEQECVKRAQIKYTGSTENNVQEGKATAGCLVKFSVRLLSVLGDVHLSEKYTVFFYHMLSLQAGNTKP